MVPLTTRAGTGTLVAPPVRMYLDGLEGRGTSREVGIERGQAGTGDRHENDKGGGWDGIGRGRYEVNAARSLSNTHRSKESCQRGRRKNMSGSMRATVALGRTGGSAWVSQCIMPSGLFAYLYTLPAWSFTCRS